MKINIASKNPVKVQAVKEVINDYKFLSDAEIVSLEVSSEVSNQPKSLEETVKGAVNRAKNSFKDCAYSIGIESGLMKVPYTKTGNMNFCVCAIYDGKEPHLGLSSAFELPSKVIEEMKQSNINLNDAFYKCGLTKNKNIASSVGAIGVLTKNRITRKDYTKQAIYFALIHLEL